MPFQYFGPFDLFWRDLLRLIRGNTQLRVKERQRGRKWVYLDFKRACQVFELSISLGQNLDKTYHVCHFYVKRHFRVETDNFGSILIYILTFFDRKFGDFDPFSAKVQKILYDRSVFGGWMHENCCKMHKKREMCYLSIHTDWSSSLWVVVTCNFDYWWVT